MNVTFPIGAGWENVVPGGAEDTIRTILLQGSPNGQALVDLINELFPDRVCSLFFSGPFYSYAIGPGQGIGPVSIIAELDNGQPVDIRTRLGGKWVLHGYGPGPNPGTTEGSVGRDASVDSTFSYPSGAIVPQLGLLEDDIAYRLALLAVNVLEPLKAIYPGIVIVSGFRRANSNIGQHELGEAVDIQIRNQTPALIYEVADYIQKNLNFDQLILNWTNIGDRQPWIHVSFSPNTLRGDVLTKDFADVFHDGLYIVTELTGTEADNAQRENAELSAKLATVLQTQQAREKRLQPKTAIESTGGSDASGSTTGGDEGASGDAGGHGDQTSVVRCVHAALSKVMNVSGSPEAAFEVTKRVAWLLRTQGAGLLIKNGGENIIPWQGYSFSAGRICFPNGNIVKIMTDVGGANGPTWDDNGFVETSLYVPAIDPGDTLTTEWQTCGVSE